MSIKPNHDLISCIFLRLLGLIYLIAFISVWTQIDGLIGSNGILPIKDFLLSIEDYGGKDKYFMIPSVFWFNQSDYFLHLICFGGVLFSILLIVNMLTSLSLILLWIFYLSICTVSQEFLSFQWDALLLETGFLSIFLLPLNLSFKPRLLLPSNTLVIWLFRILLFKFILFSGIVKLASGDLVWRNLTALTYHYQTQPLPNVISYYFHHLPLQFHKLSCLITFFIELIVPFFIFCTRKMRLFAFLTFLFFQLMIMITGNYCFFNLLAIALCFLLLDDSFLKSLRKHFPFNQSNQIKILNWSKIILIPLFILIILMNSIYLTRLFSVQSFWPVFVRQVYSFVVRFHSINSYGLFAVMTVKRPEIIIEGSNDGVHWLQYEFKYKPDKLNEPPPFIAPHQPRLDWQMWFAALSTFRKNPWFINLCVSLFKD